MALVKKKTKTILSRDFILSALQAGFAATMDALVPPTCPICRRFMQKQHGICGACWQDLNFITGPVCRITGHPMPVDLGAQTINLAAQMRPPPYHMARAAFAYDGSAAELIKRFKFRDRVDLADFFAPHMLRCAAEMVQDGVIYVPVPLHRWRLLARRFNQSAALCRALARLSPYGVETNALRRIRATPHQIGLSRDARRRNLHGAFAVPEKYRPRLVGRTVILVDDVLTTGATVEACSKILKAAGVKQVEVLTIARVVMPEQIRLS
jgi:ComF family protein